jgi:hypothetical protein
MTGLVQTDRGPARKIECGDRAPSSLLYGRERHPLLFENTDVRLEVITHQIEDGSGFVRRMNGDLGWWYGKDQPAVSHVDVLEMENIPKKGPIGVRILAEDDQVGTEDHWISLSCGLVAVEKRAYGVR